MIPLKDNMLRGSYPPLITPFRDGQVDLDAIPLLPIIDSERQRILDTVLERAGVLMKETTA